MDLLSAFAEKALSGFERAPVLEHLAQCSDCREIVFLSAPELQHVISAANNPAPRPSPSRWISWPVVRWGTAAACAAIVVAAVRLHPGYRAQESEAPVAIAVNQAGTQTAAAGREEEPSPRTSPVESDEESSPVRRTHYPTGKAKAVPELVNLRYDDAFYRQMALLSDDEENTGNRPPRWTLTASGILERSLDGGNSWKRIHIANDQVRIFRAVSASGQSIWVGGQKGILFHSTDAGRHWTQMKESDGRSLPTSDIVGIEFEDEVHGKLTTASNESWITSDAGRSWQRQ